MNNKQNIKIDDLRYESSWNKMNTYKDTKSTIEDLIDSISTGIYFKYYYEYFQADLSSFKSCYLKVSTKLKGFKRPKLLKVSLVPL